MTRDYKAEHDERLAGVVPTKATPRTHPLKPDHYTGAELTTRSARPGAYQALTMPSLINGRSLAPGEQMAQWQSVTSQRPIDEPVPEHKVVRIAPPAIVRAVPIEAPPPPDVPPRLRYRPRPGSIPDRVINALTERGPNAALTYIEVIADFGVARHAIGPSFAAALQAGVLIRVICKGRAGLALPGYVAPEPTTVPVKQMVRETFAAPDPDAELHAQALQQLEHRKQAVRIWKDYVDALRRRIEFERSVDYMRPPLPSLAHLPAA